MMISLQSKVSNFLNSFGFNLARYQKNSLKECLKLYLVDTIFDIGANKGDSVINFRYLGYKGKIISFEPIKKLFQNLDEKAKKSKNWEVENYALSDKIEQKSFNISGGDGSSSSFLEMDETLIAAAPDQKYIQQETVKCSTLSEMVKKHYPIGDRLFLKIDVQGFEKNVLEGGLDVLDRVIGIQIELSIKSQYKGELLYTEMIDYLSQKGFSLIRFENVWYHQVSKELYQVDAIFFRANKVPLS